MTTEKPRLLLVDDEVHITSALNRLFRLDYSVTCCDNAEQALTRLATDDYAVIVSDMRMPRMDGATLLAKARKLKPDTVRILLTGQSDLPSIVRAINEGQIFNYISKPWDNKQLSRTLKTAVEHYQLQHALQSATFTKNRQF